MARHRDACMSDINQQYDGKTDFSGLFEMLSFEMIGCGIMTNNPKLLD